MLCALGLNLVLVNTNSFLTLFRFDVVQQPNAVADGQLITGQNPASSVAVAELVLKAI